MYIHISERKVIMEVFDNDWSEHYLIKGNPDYPTYYFIRRQNIDVGLFSNFIVFAGHIRYALSKHYIPVIDCQNYTNNYLDPKLLGKENSWEYYFKQPFGIGVDTVLATVRGGTR